MTQLTNTELAIWSFLSLLVITSIYLYIPGYQLITFAHIFSMLIYAEMISNRETAWYQS